MKKIYCILFLGLLFSGCDRETKLESYVKINGEAQGTTYFVSYQPVQDRRVSKEQIDSIFIRIDSSLSVWKIESVINNFNSLDSLSIEDSHFINVFYRSMEIGRLSGGAFNFQIAPIVDAWGFGKERQRPESILNPDSLMNLVHTPISYEVMDDSESIHFTKLPDQRIDVNGIAQGYSVDVIFDFLKSQGIKNLMIEVGGEVRTEGKNAENRNWSIGIDRPVTELENRELQAIVEVDNKSLATSGSYRKYYELGGQKFSHTIDPSSGYPVNHNLLSVTVLASNCTNADAFATAFMVMGLERTLQFLDDNPGLEMEVFMIYADDNGDFQTKKTPGFPLKDS